MIARASPIRDKIGAFLPQPRARREVPVHIRHAFPHALGQLVAMRRHDRSAYRHPYCGAPSRYRPAARCARRHLGRLRERLAVPAAAWRRVCTAILASVHRAEDVTADSFGNYTQGRFAWKMEDVQPVVPPVPAKGGQGWWNWERVE